jgi:tRNA threonylcarbamoyladenosine biosynthesis protein TsaE
MRTESSTATKKVAEALAKKIIAKGPRKNNATVIALVGDLGVGKTTFAQGFARALGIKSSISSPTFLIFRKYQLAIRHSPFANFYHVDLYRIKKPSELNVLGFREILKNPQNIVAIEWADKAKRLIPTRAGWFYFDHGKTLRERIIKNRPSR